MQHYWPLLSSRCDRSLRGWKPQWQFIEWPITIYPQTSLVHTILWKQLASTIFVSTTSTEFASILPLREDLSWTWGRSRKIHSRNQIQPIIPYSSTAASDLIRRLGFVPSGVKATISNCSTMVHTNTSRSSSHVKSPISCLVSNQNFMVKNTDPHQRPPTWCLGYPYQGRIGETYLIADRKEQQRSAWASFFEKWTTKRCLRPVTDRAGHDLRYATIQQNCVKN